ncbi:MAG: DUF2974 domain-containing protein [Ruminococcaceae bacterium]|nr:DUF2974 domain-containing protein [Oscillospiraceae bacterium]
MSNFLDYLDWRGDLTFQAAPFCEVDNLIFSMLAFADYSGIVPDDPLDGPVRLSRCGEAFFEMYPEGLDYGVIIPQKINDLLHKASASERFGEVYVTGYRNEVDEEAGKQFAAVTFLLPDNSLFIAFRGTDDTLVGWREDFQLSFTTPVPSQKSAVRYVEEMSRLYRGDIRLGGHSKGGNLAVFAAAFSSPDVKKRIITAYSNDGPGFTEEILAREEYTSMEKRIVTFVPQSSIVGMLLAINGSYRVIKSTSPMLLQHDPGSWQVIGPRFETMPGLSEEGKRNSRRFREWLKNMDHEDRRVFTDTLFHVLEATGAQTLRDLTEDTFKSVSAMVRTVRELKPEQRSEMMRFICLLFLNNPEKK